MPSHRSALRDSSMSHTHSNKLTQTGGRWFELVVIVQWGTGSWTLWPNELSHRDVILCRNFLKGDPRCVMPSDLVVVVVVVVVVVEMNVI